MYFEKGVPFDSGVQHQSNFWLSWYKTRNNLSPESIQPECTKAVEIDKKIILIPSQNICENLLICCCWEN